MSVSVVRLGSPRRVGEGLRLGTVRFPPRGVAKADWSRCDWFDVWYPNLAPSAALLRAARADTSPSGWRQFARRYRHEMSTPGAQRDLALLAALSHQTDFSVGCYCADPTYCHRTLLRELLRNHGAVFAD
jgi:uncharacterized protein YeaO (DUF488 family)